MQCDLPLSDFLVSENAAVWPAYGSCGSAGSLVVSGSQGLQSLHFGASGLLFDVLNRKFATGGLDLSEAI